MTTEEALKKLRKETEKVFEKHEKDQRAAEEKLAALIKKRRGGES